PQPSEVHSGHFFVERASVSRASDPPAGRRQMDAEIGVQAFEMEELAAARTAEERKEKLRLGRNDDPRMTVQRLLEHGRPRARTPNNKELLHGFFPSRCPNASTRYLDLRHQ